MVKQVNRCPQCGAFKKKNAACLRCVKAEIQSYITPNEETCNCGHCEVKEGFWKKVWNKSYGRIADPSLREFCVVFSIVLFLVGLFSSTVHLVITK